MNDEMFEKFRGWMENQLREYIEETRKTDAEIDENEKEAEEAYDRLVKLAGDDDTMEEAIFHFRDTRDTREYGRVECAVRMTSALMLRLLSEAGFF